MAFLEVNNGNSTVRVPLATREIIFLEEQPDGLFIGTEKPAGATKAAILQTHRCWVLMDFTGHDLYVNDLRVADFKRVSEGDAIRIGRAAIRLYEEIRQEEVRLGSPLLAPRVICQYCQTGFEVTEQVIFCPACDTPYHADCWSENSEGYAFSARCGYHRPQTAVVKDAQGGW